MNRTEATRLAKDILALPKEALVSAYAIDPLEPENCDPWSALEMLAKGDDASFVLSILGGVRVTASNDRVWMFPHRLVAG